MTSLYDFTVASAGGPVTLWDHHGAVVLVVPTGRESGPSPQLQGLQRLADTFAAKGLVVLLLPDPPVPGQAAPTAPALGVTVPVLGPTDESGAAALLAWLSQQAPGAFGTEAAPGYTKFLVGRDGAVVRRFAATDDPAELIAAVQQALAAPVPPPPPPAVPEPVEGPVPAAPVPEALEGSEPPAELPREESLSDIAQDLYEVEAEVRMTEQLAHDQRQAAIEAELAAALGEHTAVSGEDQPGTHVTADPSIPDGETTPRPPEQFPHPPAQS